MHKSPDLARGTRAWAEIDLEALSSNVRSLRACFPSPIRLLAVVKADAYGHGLIPVASAALAAGAEWLGVAAVQEGIALREAGITAPIALLCVSTPEEAHDILDHRLIATVGDMSTLDSLISCLHHQRSSDGWRQIHLEIDTGMGRSGIQPSQASALWRAAVQGGLRVTGISTHFSDADGVEETFSREQERLFMATWQDLTNEGAQFDTVHLSNSPAALRFPGSRGNMVRPGLLLYGILPAQPPIDPAAVPLTPVLTLKAKVATVRSVPENHPISYGVTYRTQRPSRIATVLIGYGDGYPRRLSNRGTLLLHGRPAPILGRICMDQLVVDVTDIPGVVPDDEAVCIGRQGEERITVEEIAAQIETTEHEITTCLTPRIPRVYLPTLQSTN